MHALEDKYIIRRYGAGTDSRLDGRRGAEVLELHGKLHLSHPLNREMGLGDGSCAVWEVALLPSIKSGSCAGNDSPKPLGAVFDYIDASTPPRAPAPQIRLIFAGCCASATC